MTSLGKNEIWDSQQNIMIHYPDFNIDVITRKTKNRRFFFTHNNEL